MAKGLKRSTQVVAQTVIKPDCEISKLLSNQCYQIIYHMAELKQWITDIRRVGLLAFDTFTNIINKDIITAPVKLPT
ncbi:hypothetical protein CEX73_01495, partial [Candidatus Palibaumannia cicadellinicola]